MGRSRMMGAGNACSSLYKTNTNEPTGGGNKKQGLVSYVGLSDHANRALLIGANGSSEGRKTLFVQNQLSGVSSSEFRRASSYARSDGVHPQSAPTHQVSQSLQGIPLITSLTDKFLYFTTVLNDADATASLFCSEGILMGTVSQIIRTGNDIKRYFDYFVNLDQLTAISKAYTISQIPGTDVWINNAYITFQYWNGTSYSVIQARMQFTYDGSCIYELYSAQLPALNSHLVEISGKP